MRQVTDSPFGVGRGGFDPAGNSMWWFAYNGAGWRGRWMRARAEGGPSAEVLPGAPADQPEGFSLAADGSAAAAFCSDGGTSLWLADVDGSPPLQYWFPYLAYIGGMSHDGRRILIVHSESGDPRLPALRLLDRQGNVLAELDQRPEVGLFTPRYEDPFFSDGRILVTRIGKDRHRPLLWDPDNDVLVEPDLALPGDLYGKPTATEDGLILHHRHLGRSELYRCCVDGSGIEDLGVPQGTVHRFAGRSDGDVWYLHSSSASSPTLLSSRDNAPLLSHIPVEEKPNTSYAARRFTTRGPGGSIVSFRTEAVETPGAAVFLLHGGPAVDDGDEYLPNVNAWVDAGYLVVRINYRGSEGYGTAWRFGHNGKIGLTELEDVVAVRSHLVQTGIVDPRRCLLAGASWGGYLTLLGVGRYPDLWSCGIAESPIADYALAYAEEAERLRILDRALFGGTPAEVPERYHASSPLSYVSAVRVPLLVIASDDDSQCPIQQVRSYVAAREAVGGDIRVIEHQSGHGTRSAAELDDITAAQLEFAKRNAEPGPGLGDR